MVQCAFLSRFSHSTVGLSGFQNFLKSEARWERFVCDKGQLQVVEDAVDNGIVGDEGNDSHLILALGIDYKDKVVYHNDPNGEMDIYMFDISARQETQITYAQNWQRFPYIYGNKIVWEDSRKPEIPGNDIYMYDIKTGQETQITNAEY